MAQQIINIGTVANDGTGDLVRTAFDKANDNFTELYTFTVGAVGVPVDNQIAVWTGSGAQEGDANLTWDGTTLTVTGDITVTGTVDGRDVATDGIKLDGIAEGAGQPPAIISVTASRSLALTDAGDILEINTAGGAVVVTIPTNATVAFPIGTTITIALIDATNAATIVGGAGVTLNGVVSGSGTITNAAFSVITIYKRATDVWATFGAVGTVA